MTPLNLADVTTYVEQNIGSFHGARLARITGLTLAVILRGKNPYLFRAKDTRTADQLVRSVLDAYLSSGEETMFGNFLEELAVFINGRVYGGRKAGIAGIDLDFEKDGIRYLVAIKSGPVWGNANAIARMVDNFNTARRTLRTSGGHRGPIEFVNGCCYGVDDNPDKRQGYSKLCGQRFWWFISGSESLYEDLIIPLGHRAAEWNAEFAAIYEATRERLIEEMLPASLILPDGSIDWQRLVQLTSKIRREN